VEWKKKGEREREREREKSVLAEGCPVMPTNLPILSIINHSERRQTSKSNCGKTV